MSLYDRAAIIPGRSMTRSKAPDRLRRAWASDATGAQICDADGCWYLDMVCGLGAISLGYERWRERFSSGVYSLPHEDEVYAAEAVLTHVAPWASSVRFVKTGSEATHAAYRIAKRATGRGTVMMGDWAYHGWHEWTEECRPTFAPGADLDAVWADYVRFSDGSMLSVLPAAVFIEPPRWAPVDPAWLRQARVFCDRVGALLVFDEMIYGGRWALGGLTEYAGIIPDLACYGKAFGNGEAVAFVVGREALAEHGEIVSGTFSGDVTGLSAVIETIRTYTTAPVIDTLWARGRQLHAGLSQVIPSSVATLSAPAPLIGLTFATPELRLLFRDGMHARGVLTCPDWLMTMYAHMPSQIDQVIQAAARVCQTLR
jgi:glutamate-1-semialdehyde aminotransferase